MVKIFTPHGCCGGCGCNNIRHDLIIIAINRGLFVYYDDKKNNKVSSISLRVRWSIFYNMVVDIIYNSVVLDSTSIQTLLILNK